MSRLSMIRLGVAFVAIVLWGYGYSMDDAGVRLTGIVLLAVSLLLRFAGPRPGSQGPAT